MSDLLAAIASLLCCVSCTRAKPAVRASVVGSWGVQDTGFGEVELITCVLRAVISGRVQQGNDPRNRGLSGELCGSPCTWRTRINRTAGRGWSDRRSALVGPPSPSRSTCRMPLAAPRSSARRPRPHAAWSTASRRQAPCRRRWPRPRRCVGVARQSNPGISVKRLILGFQFALLGCRGSRGRCLLMTSGEAVDAASSSR